MSFRISLTRSKVLTATRGRCFSSNRKSRNMSSVQALRQEHANPESYPHRKKSRFPSQQNGVLQGKPDIAVADKASSSEHLAEAATNEFESPSELTYTGGVTIPITSFLHVITPEEDTPSGTWPIFRLMVRSNLAHADSIVLKHKTDS
jgi:hypothetical protein